MKQEEIEELRMLLAKLETEGLSLKEMDRATKLLWIVVPELLKEGEDE